MLIDDGTEGLSERVIGVAIDIHRVFGPGLLEKAYVLALVWALEKRGFSVEFERPLSIQYDGRVIRNDRSVAVKLLRPSTFDLRALRDPLVSSFDSFAPFDSFD
jgi:hypothetical protein